MLSHAFSRSSMLRLEDYITQEVNMMVKHFAIKSEKKEPVDLLLWCVSDLQISPVVNKTDGLAINHPHRQLCHCLLTRVSRYRLLAADVISTCQDFVRFDVC